MSSSTARPQTEECIGQDGPEQAAWDVSGSRHIAEVEGRGGLLFGASTCFSGGRDTLNAGEMGVVSVGYNQKGGHTRIRSMKTIPLTIIALAGTFALSACDSKQENARENALERKADNKEDQADAVRNRAENQADALESQKTLSNPSSTNNQLENAADEKRRAAEAAAERLEREAEAAREKK